MSNEPDSADNTFKGSDASPKHEVASIRLLASGARVQAREFIVAPGQRVRWHSHTHLTDWCFCLEGEVSFETADTTNQRVSAQILREGEHCEIAAGVTHRLRNGGDGPCRYLLVQSGQQYDFLEANYQWLPQT